MKDDELLEIYKGMLSFLGDILGEGTEVVLHDLRDLDHSLIAIENNLTNRQIGSPITDYGRDLATSNKYETTDNVSAYKSQYKTMSFVSYEHLIRNNGKRIGLLCINKNAGIQKDLQNAYEKFLKCFSLMSNDKAFVNENLDTNIMDLLRHRLDALIEEIGVSVDRMSKSEKTEIVLRLGEEGLLRMQGAMPEVADRLHVSLPTLYRYLKN